MRARLTRFTPLAVALTVLAVTACSSDTTGGSAGSASGGPEAAPSSEATPGDATDAALEPASITFLTFQSPNLSADFWEARVAEIQEDYPDLEVEIQYTPGLDRQAYASQLLATGNLPDVIWDVPLADFVAADALLPYEEADLELIDAPADAGAIDGKHYSLTLGAQVIPLIYYNKTKLGELGLDEPTTWAELVEAAGAIKAAGETPFLVGGGADPWTSTIFLDGILTADVFGQTPDWMAQRKAGDVSFADADVISAVTKWKELLDAGYINDDALSVNYSQLQEKFAAGDGVFLPMGSWAAATTADFEIGVFGVPTDDGTTVLGQNFGQALYISAETAAPAQARAFAVAMATATEAVTGQLRADALLPVARGYVVPDDIAPLVKDTAALNADPDAVKVLPFGWEQGEPAAPSGFVAIFNTEAQKVIQGGSVEDFVSSLDTQFDDLNAG